MRALRIVIGLLVLAGCTGHKLSEHERVFQAVCGNHSCPAPGVSRPTAVLTVDGQTHRAPEAIAAGKSHVLSLRVILEKGSAITRYWVSETRRGECCSVTDQGPDSAHVLIQGQQLDDGQTMTLRWTPVITGNRELVLGYYAKAPQDRYEEDGFAGIPLGTFVVS
jgi:hypothetical protein